MSNYISKEAPKYKDWQFQSLNKGIERSSWLEAIQGFENIKPVNDDPDRFNLYSIQDPSYKIHLWHNPQKGNAITFSGFPDRFFGEFVKHIYVLCEKLEAKFYTLDNTGNQEEFNFEKYQTDIDKNYVFLNEEKVTDIEISEHMGLITIPTDNIKEVIDRFKLNEIRVSDWEEAVNECYDNKYMVRSYKDWTIIIGQTINLVTKFGLDSINLTIKRENYFNFLADLSKIYGRVAYNFNSSKYGVFEDYRFEDGKIAYKYIHEDGDEIKEGKTNKEYFNDFKSLCYDKSILNGVKLYE